jgi:hypothetical protein
MRFIHNEEIVATMRARGSVAPAESFKSQEIRACLRCGKSVPPHRRERRGRNDQHMRVTPRNRRRDERLAETNIVGQERAAKLFERSLESGDR